MKQITLLFFTLLCFLNSYSQQTEHPIKFKYHKAEEPTKMIGWKSTLNDYVVVQSKGTAEENYIKVIDYLKTIYKNPKEVIIAESENKFVKIKGFTSNLYYRNIMFIPYTNDVRYRMSFLVKSDRIKIEISSLEYFIPINSTNINTINGWQPLEEIYVHKSNGKPKKRMFGKTDTLIEDYFNSIVDGLINYKVLDKTTSDW